MTQKGLYIRAASHTVSEVPLPRAPADASKLHLAPYAELLQKADAEHLLLASVPFSELAGRKVLLVYDASGRGEPNEIASRLTLNAENGLKIEVRGDALAFYVQPGADLGEWEWQQLDNVIYDEILEFFGQGLKPTPADLQKLVDNFKAGNYDYSKRREGEEGEDVNKDDAGEDLQDALQDQ